VTDHVNVYGMSPPHRRPRRPLDVVVVVAALMAFTGCMVGPDCKRPRIAVSESWRETDDRRVCIDAATYGSWWMAFDATVLNRLVERAYQENVSLPGKARQPEPTARPPDWQPALK
jgi:hypothetical protein